MAASTAQLGDLCITTQVLPGCDTGSAALATNATTAAQSWNPSQKIKHVYTTALGTVQILIGVVQISFGVMFLISDWEYPSTTVRSGVYIWAGLVVFVTGSITVATAKKNNIKMIKACLVCHVTNLILGGIGLVLCMVQLYTESLACWLYIEDEDMNRCLSIDSPTEGPYSYNNYKIHEHIMVS
ncbi:membrane-spanning 4-domains subfamily A member 12-like [Rhinophrynus dorsalis]